MDRKIKASSGNVFADLGVANPEEHKLKAELVHKLAEVMKARGLNQTATAKRAGISQPDLSKILRGRFRDVSVARLMRALTLLDSEIEIVVRNEGREIGEKILLHAGEQRSSRDHRIGLRNLLLLWD